MASLYSTPSTILCIKIADYISIWCRLTHLHPKEPPENWNNAPEQNILKIITKLTSIYIIEQVLTFLDIISRRSEEE